MRSIIAKNSFFHDNCVRDGDDVKLPCQTVCSFHNRPTERTIPPLLTGPKTGLM